MGYLGLDERGLQEARRAERIASRGRIPKDERSKYIEEWTKNQVKFWIERIDRLRVFGTGNLRSNIEYRLLLEGAKAMISFRFPMHGKYQDDGTGREFTNEGYIDSWHRYYGPKREADGTLPFLTPGGEQYRAEHGLDKPKRVGPAWGGRIAGGHARKPQEWYFKKYYAGRMVLNELERNYYKESYLGMMTYALDQVFGQVRVL